MTSITGTFLDEISHDIPHQNWGEKEWRQDFSHMQSIGIDTVILIRCGYGRWLTYPSPYLMNEQGAYHPTTDLIDLFLRLSADHHMKLWIGLYDSGHYWWKLGDFETETEINLRVAEEIQNFYGSHSAFGGWYLSQEVSRKTKGAMNLYRKLGLHCKNLSNDLPTMISPYIEGSKAILSSNSEIRQAHAYTLKQHEADWNEMLAHLQGAVDIVAFQDGHVDYHELFDYLRVNQSLISQYGMQAWSNVETFDRDMPIKFLPIKWDKLKLKMEAADRAGMDKIITFEFSHFMSPQSCYPQAHHLFNRYTEYLGEKSI